MRRAPSRTGSWRAPGRPVTRSMSSRSCASASACVVPATPAGRPARASRRTTWPTCAPRSCPRTWSCSSRRTTSAASPRSSRPSSTGSTASAATSRPGTRRPYSSQPRPTGRTGQWTPSGYSTMGCAVSQHAGLRKGSGRRMWFRGGRPGLQVHGRGLPAREVTLSRIPLSRGRTASRRTASPLRASAPRIL